MNIGKARAIFDNINDTDSTLVDKGEAIREVLDMPTHNSVKNGYIRRIRTCCHCESRYTTIEVPVMETSISNNKTSMNNAISKFCDSVSGYDIIPNLRKAIKLWNAAQIIMSEGAEDD